MDGWMDGRMGDINMGWEWEGQGTGMGLEWDIHPSPDQKELNEWEGERAVAGGRVRGWYSVVILLRYN